jgi:hypothetical protein
MNLKTVRIANKYKIGAFTANEDGCQFEVVGANGKVSTLCLTPTELKKIMASGQDFSIGSEITVATEFGNVKVIDEQDYTDDQYKENCSLIDEMLPDDEIEDEVEEVEEFIIEPEQIEEVEEYEPKVYSFGIDEVKHLDVSAINGAEPEIVEEKEPEMSDEGGEISDKQVEFLDSVPEDSEEVEVFSDDEDEDDLF